MSRGEPQGITVSITDGTLRDRLRSLAAGVVSLTEAGNPDAALSLLEQLREVLVDTKRNQTERVRRSVWERLAE